MGPNTTTLLKPFRDLLHRRASPTAQEWFERAAPVGGGPFDRGTFLDSFAMATRRLRRDPLNLSSEELGWLEALGITWPVSSWGLDELGRVTLILMVSSQTPTAELEGLVGTCYQQGETRERQAVLRSLPLLPEADRFLSIGVDACRSHIAPLFEAIACENPYPAQHFPDLNFNQMVLKALFTGVTLERIVGLDARVTPELARMANDYASERKAAGRTVPADIWRLIGQ